MKDYKFITQKAIVYCLVGLLILAVVVSWQTKDSSILLNKIYLANTILSEFSGLIDAVAIFPSLLNFLESIRKKNIRKELKELSLQVKSLTAMIEQLKSFLYDNSLIQNDLPKISTVNSHLQQKAIENFLRYNYNPHEYISIQYLWKDLWDNKLYLDITILKHLLNNMSKKEIIENKKDSTDIYVKLK